MLQRWLLPWAGTFVLSAAATLAITAGMPGCQTRCLSSFECGDFAYCNDGRCETECYVDDDCVHPPDCRDNPLACAPKGVRCNSIGRCVRGNGNSRPQGPLRSGPLVDIPTVIDGWDSPPGTGDPFIISQLAIADQNRGFDIDGQCRGPGDCIDNSLFQLGQLGNDQIRQGLLGGETLLLIELAGIQQPFVGTDK